MVLVPLQVGVSNLSLKKAFQYGWIAGIIAFLGTMTWVITAMNQYGQVPFLISVLLLILLASYLGLYFGLYALGYATLQSNYQGLIWIGAPSLWVTLEYLRTYAFSGLPWALMGYSQYQWLPLIQIADHSGVYGVSFLVVMGNVTITLVAHWAWRIRESSSRPFPWGPVGLFGCLLTLILVYGMWQIGQQHDHDASAKTLSIGLVQPNIDQAKKWDERFRETTLNRFDQLSQQIEANTDLLIWPEAATPFFFEKEPTYQKPVIEMVRRAGSPLLFGSPTLRFQQDGSPYLLNSAYVLKPNGLLNERYDKRHLVPFGEYIPLKSLLFFLDKLVVGIGDFIPGTGPLTMSIPSPSPEDSPRFGVAICFEVIFPDLVRRMAKEGANFLVTITNDAWFGQSSAPYQHFGKVVFRAVENHLAVARVANTGISGFIAPDGRIVAKTAIFSEQAITESIHLRSFSPTFYTQHGDVFSWGCVIIVGMVMIRYLLGLRTSSPH